MLGSTRNLYGANFTRGSESLSREEARVSSTSEVMRISGILGRAVRENLFNSLKVERGRKRLSTWYWSRKKTCFAATIGKGTGGKDSSS